MRVHDIVAGSITIQTEQFSAGRRIVTFSSGMLNNEPEEIEQDFLYVADMAATKEDMVGLLMFESNVHH